MITRDEIIKRAQEIHGDRYDYSATTDIQNGSEKIKYRCKIHNIFHTQTLYNHLQGKGCPECAKLERKKGRLLTKEEFIKKSKKRHNDLEKYDFNKTDFSYRDEKGNIILFCREHGEFSIRPNHFFEGIGCQKCAGRKKDDEVVVNKLKVLHPKLDFSETKYSERDKEGRLKVVCQEHGTKYISYWNLINGEGCYECSLQKAGEKRRLTNEEIIKRAKDMYGENTYIYNNLDTNKRGKNNTVIITCPKHGDFSVNLYNFIYGKSSCPKCHLHKMELKLSLFLERNNIKYERQKTFDWLKYKENMYLDFYLPDYKIAIECQGIQHFLPIEKWGGDDALKVIKERDLKKKTLCESHNVKMLYFMENKFKQNKDDFSSLKEILKYIIK